MSQFDQFANQGGAAAWNPDEEADEARRVAEEQLRSADYAGALPEPLPRPRKPHTADAVTADRLSDDGDGGGDLPEPTDGAEVADGAAEPTKPDVPRDLDVPDDLGD